MNTQACPLFLSTNRNLLARATIALLAVSAFVLTPQALAAGQPPPKHKTAHANIILQHHAHPHAKSAHSKIILQHH